MGRLLIDQDDVERLWHQSFERLRPILQQPCEAAVSASLHSLVHEGAEQEVMVGQALMYGMLTQPHVGPALFRHMSCLRDLGAAVTLLVELVLRRFGRLQQPAKQQLLWLLSQLAGARVRGTPALAIALLRHAGSGDASPPTFWLAENLVSLFGHHAAWLTEEPELVAPVLLSLLRLAAEHGGGGKLRAQQDKELRLCALLWARAPAACLGLGRELWRALRPLRGTPPAHTLWQQLHEAQAQADAAGARGPLGARAPAAALRARVAPEAERCLRFMLGEPAGGKRPLLCCGGLSSSPQVAPKARSLPACPLQASCGRARRRGTSAGSSSGSCAAAATAWCRTCCVGSALPPLTTRTSPACAAAT